MESFFQLVKEGMHFVPLIPVGTVGIPDAEWVTVKRKPNIGKRKAKTPKVATSPSKKKLLNFQFPLNQGASLPTQPLVQRGGSPQAKPKGAVSHPQSIKNAANAELPAGSPEAEPKGAVLHHQSKQDGTGQGCKLKKIRGRKGKERLTMIVPSKKTGQNNGASSQQQTIHIASTVQYVQEMSVVSTKEGPR